MLKGSSQMNKNLVSSLFAPRNKDPNYKVETTRTVKVGRDPSISDMIEKHLIFHQRCDAFEHMVGQLLERSRKHPLTREDSQPLTGKGCV